MSYQYPFSDVDERTKRAVWNKGRYILGRDPNVWRSDMCNGTIRYDDHGDTNSPYGWEIDHIVPVVLGGTDDFNNLQPLHWENNRRKGDTNPWFGEHAA